MKILLFLLLFFPFCAISQLEEGELDSLKKVWTADLKAQMVEMRIGVFDPEESQYTELVFSDSVRLEFAKDTFLLNGLFTLQSDADQTTFGMSRAAYDYETGLDALLNKYYALLLKKLTKEDRELLRESQRNWIKFRDAERKLSGTLTMDNYTGGGTIQSLIHSARYFEITRTRLYEIVDYLERLWAY